MEGAGPLPQPESADNGRNLLLVSYEIAASGLSRNVTDITYTRNWLVTGLTVYCGAILAAGRLTWYLNIPPFLVTILALWFTMYERGNGELLRKYCQDVESGATSLPLETWLKQWNMGKRSRDKIAYYVSVFGPKWTYWWWMVLLAAGIVFVAMGISWPR